LTTPGWQKFYFLVASRQFYIVKINNYLSKNSIMKSLKFFGVPSIVVVLFFSLSSCKKDKESVPAYTVTKDQLLGKWNMFTILPGGFNEKDEVNLKANGVMEFDIEKTDGIVDYILSWDVKNNVFTAHLDLNGVSNVWTLTAQIDPKTLLISGEKTMIGAGNNPVNLIFGMEKQ
jgi:hypothetical protein